MTLKTRNAMCNIFERYCNTQQREQHIDFSSETYKCNYREAAAIIKELKENGFISRIEKLGQTHYRFRIEDELIEYYK